MPRANWLFRRAGSWDGRRIEWRSRSKKFLFVRHSARHNERVSLHRKIIRRCLTLQQCTAPTLLCSFKLASDFPRSAEGRSESPSTPRLSAVTVVRVAAGGGTLDDRCLLGDSDKNLQRSISQHLGQSESTETITVRCAAEIPGAMGGR